MRTPTTWKPFLISQPPRCTVANQTNICACSCSRSEMQNPKPMKLFLPASAACAAVVAAAVLAGCTQKPAANVLARVGDKDITVADFKAEIERRQAAHQPLP